MVPGARRPPDRTATYRQESLLYQDIRPASRQPPGCQVAWAPPLTTRGLQPPPPTLPYGAGVGGQGPPAAEVESPPSRASLNHQSSKDDSQLHNSCRQGWDLMAQHPHKRHRHCRDSGRIERTTDSQAFPPTVEATIHAHREDNKPLTPPQKISQPDLHSLEQALRADLDQSCPPRTQSSSTPSTKLVPGAKRAAADLSKHERARRL